LDEPHAGHRIASDDPHDAQYLRSGRFSVPHAGQTSGALASIAQRVGEPSTVREGPWEHPPYTRGAMDDPRWEAGMPALDRQPVREPVLPPSLQGLPPRSVPETRPTPLQKHYVLLSVPVLIAGTVAITALELGVPASSPLVKLCVLVAAPLLLITGIDATVRIWRSAWAWMPVDRVKGLFRLTWVVATLTILLIGSAFSVWVLAS
jgi:hypothetical protein